MPWFSRAAKSTSSSTPPSSGGGVFDSIGQGLIDPLMQSTQGARTVMGNIGKVAAPIGGGIIGAIGNIKKTGQSLQKAKKGWKGKSKEYSYDDQTGMVNESIRGVDTEDANGFEQELARDNLEKGIHSGIKTVTGLGKSAQKSMGAVGKVWKLGKNVTDAVDPFKAANQMATGGHKMIKGGMDAVRFQKRKKAARQGQEQAEQQNNPLAMGLKATKRGLSSSRNEAIGDGILGGLTAATGGLGMAQYVDPTGGTFLAHKILSGITKVAKKGNMVRGAIKEGMRSEKVMKMRSRADQGDPEAMKWMLENDPRTASAQLLMHAQQGSDEQKSFAQEHIAKSLSLGEQGQKELATGKLSEFDKLYSNRTGMDIESKLGWKEAGIYKVARKPINAIKGLWKGAKGLFGRGKDKTAPKLPEMSSNDIADQFTALTGVLDKESQAKTQTGGELSHDQMDEVWTSDNKLDPQFMPNRGKSEVREYNRVKDFRIDKTYSEMVDKAESRSLKQRMSGEGDGKLFNLDDYQGGEQAIDGMQSYIDGPDGLLDKITAKADKLQSMAAKKVGPWADDGLMPEDIRQGLIAKDLKRRNDGQTAGRNLPSIAPSQTDWKERQTTHNNVRGELRTMQKEAGTTVGQRAKARRKEEKANKKQEAERRKAQEKRLKKQGW